MMTLNLPEICRNQSLSDAEWQEIRGKIIRTLCEEEYGFLPPLPKSVDWEITETDNEFCAGKAPLVKAMLKITLSNNSSFSFPVSAVIPSGAENIPFFVYISFSPHTPDKFLPSEEIADNGYGVFSFYYEDVTADNADFSNGLPGELGIKDNSDCGKIALWAWAVMRVMDFACSFPLLDFSRAAVAGHSRLGKTALLAGALDERFKFIISNNSGCCGAAVSRGKKGETIRNITDAFGYWFKASFKKFADNEEALPFDQHFLIAASAPRFVYVSSAQDDSWADPHAELLGCKAAGSVWEKLGFSGLIIDDEEPVIGKQYNGGRIAYHVRKGGHFLSREDWRNFMEFINVKCHE